MFLVSSFAVVLQELAIVMTAPSFQNLVTVLTGWIFARRHTVTGMLTAAGVAGKRHHAAFHRVFAQAPWSLDALGLSVFRILEPLLDKDPIFVALDDTLARKRGKKTFGVGMHHDPLLSSRGKTVTNWGHSWVVLGVVVRFPLWPERAFCLPILFRLYLNQQAAERERRAYKWFATDGHRHYRPPVTTWYVKPHAAFGDMLGTLRRLSLRERIFAWGLHGPGSQKIQQTLENMLSLAA